MIVIGIDPGKKGGLARVGPSPRGFQADVMPEHPQDIFAWLERSWLGFKPKTHIFLEKAQSFPREGAVQAFNYGHHNGVLEGFLQAMRVPYTLVKPQVWMKVMHAGADSKLDTKDRSIQVCRRLFPEAELVPERCRKPHDGMAEALLLAEYGRRVLTGAPVPPAS